MELDRIVSDFYMRSAAISELQIDNKIAAISQNMNKKFGLDISSPSICREEDGYYGDLTINIFVEVNEGDSVVSSISMTVHGDFFSSMEVKEEVFEQMITINGAAALYGIARSKLETITATIYSSGKILIPFVNVYEFYQEKAKNNQDNTEEP
jgi:preprotein translocase subunit SecB